jgi:hypothetical protein
VLSLAQTAHLGPTLVACCVLGEDKDSLGAVHMLAMLLRQHGPAENSALAIESVLEAFRRAVMDAQEVSGRGGNEICCLRSTPLHLGRWRRW